MRIVSRMPFLLLGGATLGTFYGTSLLTAAAAAIVMPVLQVLIVPIWAGWDLGMLVTWPAREAVAPAGIAALALGAVAYGFGFVPYLLGDLALYTIRRKRTAGA